MEVHHPHLIHKKKHFNEYLFEFIMIFFAVFLGFIAENFRVTLENKRKEKEYIRSLIEDIKSDTTQLTAIINQLGRRDQGIDTLLVILKDPATITNSNKIFKLRENLGFRDFIYTDRTIQQLKSTGEFRLIRKIDVSNKIISYDASARNVVTLDNILNSIIGNVLISVNNIFDFSNIGGWSSAIPYDQLQIPQNPIPLLTTDKKEIIRLYNIVTDYKRFALGFKKALAMLRKEGASLALFLKKEYYAK